MKEKNKISQVLDWTYDKAINGLGHLESAEELAQTYLRREGSLEDKINSFIRWQNTKCFTSGFLSGLGGLITMPVTIPANVSSVLYVQVRMCATIAVMGGYDAKDDRVRTLVYACLLGNGIKDVLKNMGIVFGNKLSKVAIKKISFEAIKKINQRIGFRLITKFGEKGILNLGKAIPVVGGLIGGTFDLVSSNAVGNVARNTFATA
ncbi:MAG TPA: EcsC family protein [Ignavibacteria bacterium]|nr:EcsC family protein [Ignavibacteria bacterium]HMQ97534.1 EcsC family protein [Ignavibacteria bacterium]